MNQPIFILINLRGGVDGLNFLVPYREAEYYRSRPGLAVPPPHAPGPAALDLDGFWGAHPALAPLLRLYERQELAFIQAVGWPGDSHSHFEAWEEIESGVAGGTIPTTGWLARLLQAKSATTRTPLRGVAFGEVLPKVLLGTLGVSAFRSLRDYRLRVGEKSGLALALGKIYEKHDTPFSRMGSQTLAGLKQVEQVSGSLDFKQTDYPKTEFGERLFAVEQLIRAGVGLEAVSLDLPGWDTHFGQGSTSGAFANLAAELASAITTFWNRLEDQRDRLCLLAMSEFGRRVAENGSGGTDHGQGGVMLVCGKGIRGGRVYGEWPGLAPERQVGPGDVRITTDYRQVLLELAHSLVPNGALPTLFPGYSPTKALGFCAG
ncbi:MAG: DUF1501 domain-containing protein [Blastocatellia bacterium]|nr:DUF1501 domain-containing protein [Blastocatellia bacterium]